MGLVRTDTSVSISRQQPRSRVTTNTRFLKNGQFLHFISCSRVTAGVNGASETMSTHFHAPNQLIRASAYVRICQGSQHSRNLQCDLICTLYLLYTELLFLGVHGFWCPEGIIPQQSSKCKGSCINLLPASHFDGMTCIRHVFSFITTHRNEGDRKITSSGERNWAPQVSARRLPIWQRLQL